MVASALLLTFRVFFSRSKVPATGMLPLSGVDLLTNMARAFAFPLDEITSVEAGARVTLERNITQRGLGLAAPWVASDPGIRPPGH